MVEKYMTICSSFCLKIQLPLNFEQTNILVSEYEEPLLFYIFFILKKCWVVDPLNEV